MEKLQWKKRTMLSVVPREILEQILENCKKLNDVKNCCEAEDITLSKTELDSLSRKFKLPFYNEKRLASGTKNRGLSYLLRCERLGVRELVLEFLTEDDPRVLEYFPVKIVITYLFPYEYYISDKAPDCPVIVRELLKLDEWNTIFVAMSKQYNEYPLVSCVNSNSLEMMKVLLEDGKIKPKNSSLETAILSERLHIVEFLLSKSPSNVNWDSLVNRAHRAKNRAIFNLFLSNKSGNTCNWDKFFLDFVNIGDIERVTSMIEHGKVYSLMSSVHPLRTAAKVNQVEVIQLLLLRQETTDESINQAFRDAIYSKSIEAATLFLESGRVNKDKVITLRDELSQEPKVVLHKALSKHC